MQFQFESFKAFIEMGGHGPYIWMCYLFVLVAWGYLALAPRFQTNAFFKQQIKRQKRLNALDQQANQDSHQQQSRGEQ